MAAEKVICEVSSDLDSDTGKMVVEMDPDNRSIVHLYQDSYHNLNRVSRIELNASELSNGIVLNRKDKYITVRMYSHNYDPERGGILYLDTLYNGVTSERREYEIQLSMDKEGPMLIRNKVRFSKMKFIAKKSKVLGVIGIEKVVFGE